jgi:hypothetical protein
MQTATSNSSLSHQWGHNVCFFTKLWAGRLRIRVSIPSRDRNVSKASRLALEPNQPTIQTKSGARPLTGTAKAVWYWPLSCAEDKMRGYIPPFLHTSSWHGDELRTGTTLPCETLIPTAMPLLWNLTPCSRVERNRHFGETCCLGFRV